MPSLAIGTDLFKKLKYVLLLLALPGCPSPAGPPAPPAEVPAALRFPATVGVDLTTISAASSSSALVAPGGEFSNTITAGTFATAIVNDQVDAFLKPLNSIEIPVSTSTTHIRQTVTFDAGTPSAVDRDVKIDFSDYDFDGDGTSEGCSGHTAALPICFRIWFDGARRMAGLFTEFPTKDNPGAGHFKVIGEDRFIGVSYNHADPKNLETDFSFAELAKPGETFSIDFSETFHIALAQTGPKETALKTVNISAESDKGSFQVSPTIGTSSPFQYLGRFLEDADFWSGKTVDAAGDVGTFENICAEISNGAKADRDNCLRLGIDVGEIPFLDFVTDKEVLPPSTANFPAGPTF
jgi:hypothetical protein